MSKRFWIALTVAALIALGVISTTASACYPADGFPCLQSTTTVAP